ncbi:MAG: hypothetical protein U9O82_14095 [Thermodesulfobacteriota bacterium]|nr:hypothetical protein [Thermodesulfobacteriota bacterium]
MAEGIKIRWRWLKFMYIYIIIGGIGAGLGIILIPDIMKSLFRWPIEEPIMFGLVGSVDLGFGIISILGFRSPLKFAPVLLLQLCYKAVFLVAVVLPLLVTAQFPGYAIFLAVIYATYVIGDAIAIPFSYIFKKGDRELVRYN